MTARILLAVTVNIAVVPQLRGSEGALLVALTPVEKCGHGSDPKKDQRPRSMALVELRSVGNRVNVL